MRSGADGPLYSSAESEIIFNKGASLCAQEPDFQEEDSQHASARPERNGSHPDGGALHESPTGGGGASLADVKAARAELELGAHGACVFAHLFLLPGTNMLLRSLSCMA